MKRRARTSWTALAAGPLLCLAAWGCQPPPPPPQKTADLPPAYVRNRIEDPALRAAAEEIRTQVLREVGTGGRLLYSRAEVLPPAQTVQPYGVGSFQQEPRLPVILTTGPGWAGLKPAEREAKVAEEFTALAAKLEALKRTPLLRPTLTIQTPEGIELAWINHLDPGGKNLHGDGE